MQNKKLEKDRLDRFVAFLVIIFGNLSNAQKKEVKP